MAQARINGHLINVSQEHTGEGLAKDTVYTISGDAAAKFREILVSLKANPSELMEGSFTVKKSALLDPTMAIPMSAVLESQLAATAAADKARAL